MDVQLSLIILGGILTPVAGSVIALQLFSEAWISWRKKKNEKWFVVRKGN